MKIKNITKKKRKRKNKNPKKKKKRGFLNSEIPMHPARNVMNGLMLLTCIGIGIAFQVTSQLLLVALLSICAGFLGLHSVISIGTADMPVVICMLNSFSGWSIVANGLILLEVYFSLKISKKKKNKKQKIKTKTKNKKQKTKKTKI